MENVDCDLNNSTLTAVSGKNTCNVKCDGTQSQYTGQYVCSNEGGNSTTSLDCGKLIFSDSDELKRLIDACLFESSDGNCPNLEKSNIIAI